MQPSGTKKHGSKNRNNPSSLTITENKMTTSGHKVPQRSDSKKINIEVHMGKNATPVDMSIHGQKANFINQLFEIEKLKLNNQAPVNLNETMTGTLKSTLKKPPIDLLKQSQTLVQPFA